MARARLGVRAIQVLETAAFPDNNTRQQRSTIRENSVLATPLDARPEIDGAAFYGALGAWVKLTAPHTEASPAALLLSGLVAIGTLIGRNPTVMLDGVRHGVNLFVLLVGPTSAGRKGTAVGRVRQLLAELSPQFAVDNVASGLSSGQGLIDQVRDARTLRGGENKKDPGVTDKRLLVAEAEMSGALRQMRGRENTLSPVLREAWDGNSLRTLTKGDPLRATDPHIGIIAQITPEELRGQLEDVELFNGFLNRFLMVWCERSQHLPFGSNPDLHEEREVVERLRQAIGNALNVGRLNDLSPDAKVWWTDQYPRLTAERSGRLGAATQRAAAQVRRIALLFAAMDGANVVGLEHLLAADAVWNYASDSASYVLGGSKLSRRANTIYAGLVRAGSEGIDRTAIRDEILGSHNLSAADLDSLFVELRDAGLAVETRIATGGRPRCVWHARQFGRNGR